MFLFLLWCSFRWAACSPYRSLPLGPWSTSIRRSLGASLKIGSLYLKSGNAFFLWSLQLYPFTIKWVAPGAPPRQNSITPSTSEIWHGWVLLETSKLFIPRHCSFFVADMSGHLPSLAFCDGEMQIALTNFGLSHSEREVERVEDLSSADCASNRKNDNSKQSYHETMIVFRW